MKDDIPTTEGAQEHSVNDLYTSVVEAVLPCFPPLLKGEVNPARQTVERRHTDWLRAYGLVELSCRPETMRLHDVTAFAFPHADADVLALTADLTAWLFFVDELVDAGKTGLRLTSTREFINAVKSPLRASTEPGGTAPSPTDLAGLIHGAYGDVAARMRERMSSPQWALFEAHLDAYYEALSAETKDREQRLPPALEDYCAVRRFSTGTQCQLDLIELSESVRLPPYLYEADLFHELIHITCDIAAWTNDIFSAAKEHAAGGVHNLVLILGRQAGCTLPEAAVLAVRRIETRLRDMETARAALPALMARHHASPAAQEAARRWADGLYCFLQHADWYLGHSRYSGAAPQRR
ncbi:terpene synthase family protein [Streptomyces sp. NPDC047002]|uniref:terpene synthase family protein n=1 Tax=Streptomyces sp. NPDC047002 TaxID=3155475 RepID=UPI00345154D0